MFQARRFVSELRRRRVFRTALVYAALAWAGIEGVTTLGPVFGVSDVVVRILVVVILLGLPVAVVLSWMFDLTADGVQPDPGAPEATQMEAGAEPGAAELPAVFRPPPAQATELIGRDADVDAVADLLGGGARLATVLGPGGTGKTRLATALFHRLAPSYGGGAGFVSVAGVDQAGEVMPSVALTFEVAEVEGRRAVEGLAKLFGDREILLVLDNLEHVLDVAGEVAELMSACPGLSVLTTSRSPLKIAGEREYALSPLSVPDKDETAFDDLGDVPAVRLFVERARQVRSDFRLTPENAEAVVAICRRLDGLPLALELAAARVRVLEPHLLFERLEQALEVLTSGARDVPERQRTLRGTIDWSHSLLHEPEQRLFRRVSVFVDGWTQEAAEAVCYDPDEAGAALDEMASLLEKGLVYRDEGGRFGILQTIRDYARERLVEEDDPAVIEARHAAFYRQFAELVERGVEGAEQLDWLQRAMREDGNLDGALDWFRRAGADGDDQAVEDGLATCGHLIMLWHIRALHVHMRSAVDSLLAVRRADGPTPGWLSALNATSLASLSMGDVPRALQEGEAAYEGAIALGLERDGATYSTYFGASLLLAGELERADELLTEATERNAATGNDWARAITLAFHGMLAAATGQPEVAQQRLQAALELATRTGDREGRGVALSGLAQLAMGGGDLEGALSLYEQARTVFGTVGDRPEVARVQDEMAWCSLAAGQVGRARGLFLGSLHAHDSVGSTRGIGLALFGLASVEVADGRLESGAVVAAAAEVYSEQEGVVVDYPWVTKARDDVGAALQALSPETLAARGREGRAMSWPEVVAYVTAGREQGASALP